MKLATAGSLRLASIMSIGAVDFYLAVAFCAFSVRSWWPGGLTGEGQALLQAARAGITRTDVAPMMTKMLAAFYARPEALLIFQLSFFWATAWLMGRLTFSRPLPRILLLTALEILPPVSTQMGFVSKDTHFSISLFAVVGCLSLFARTRSPWVWLSAQVLLLYATNLRTNAVFAVLPLCIWSVSLVLSPHRRFWRIGTFGLSLVLMLMLYAVSVFINSRIFEAKDRYVFQLIQLHDLTGIAVRTDVLQFPTFLIERGLNIERLREIYTSECADAALMMGGYDGKSPRNKAEARELRNAWLAAIISEPLAYLKHRASCFWCLLYSSNQRICHGFFNRINIHPRLMHPLEPLLFSGIYLLGLSIIFLRAVCRGHVSIQAVSASGLLYGAGYFFVLPTCHYRYLYWTVLSCILAIFMAAASTACRPSRTRSS